MELLYKNNTTVASYWKYRVRALGIWSDGRRLFIWARCDVLRKHIGSLSHFGRMNGWLGIALIYCSNNNNYKL